ncbi:hypothetical protein CEXT_755081 [Caerostris extrusa]|uniref:Uncharacterized protein n=1 Tax=Caerostris extrusa TaxID=172846 RepID=A0AAV4UCV3_CAEEX|nr:hypothetical protein CEXT_755081 [Caerostris extrusa]
MQSLASRCSQSRYLKALPNVGQPLPLRAKQVAMVVPERSYYEGCVCLPDGMAERGMLHLSRVACHSPWGLWQPATTNIHLT